MVLSHSKDGTSHVEKLPPSHNATRSKKKARHPVAHERVEYRNHQLVAEIIAGHVPHVCKAERVICQQPLAHHVEVAKPCGKAKERHNAPRQYSHGVS